MENFQRFFSHDDGYSEETCGRKVVGGTEGWNSDLAIALSVMLWENL
jgi:hypothetical protein